MCALAWRQGADAAAARAQAVLASGGVAHLLAALGSEDEAVVLAASRALKMVYQVRAAALHSCGVFSGLCHGDAQPLSAFLAGA